MLTKRCYDCRQVKPLERFDRYPRSPDGRSAECIDCRRRRQAAAGYATARSRALGTLARRYPDEYRRYRQQVRAELAPHTATAETWHQARGWALGELYRRHRAEWHRWHRQLRAAHPDWTPKQLRNQTMSWHLRAHHGEFLELLRGRVGGQPAGPAIQARLTHRAWRRLQLAHPGEYQALYAAERAKLGDPVRPRRQRGRPA